MHRGYDCIFHVSAAVATEPEPAEQGQSHPYNKNNSRKKPYPGLWLWYITGNKSGESTSLKHPFFHKSVPASGHAARGPLGAGERVPGRTIGALNFDSCLSTVSALNASLTRLSAFRSFPITAPSSLC